MAPWPPLAGSLPCWSTTRTRTARSTFPRRCRSTLAGLRFCRSCSSLRGRPRPTDHSPSRAAVNGPLDGVSCPGKSHCFELCKQLLRPDGGGPVPPHYLEPHGQEPVLSFLLLEHGFTCSSPVEVLVIEVLCISVELANNLKFPPVEVRPGTESQGVMEFGLKLGGWKTK